MGRSAVGEGRRCVEEKVDRSARRAIADDRPGGDVEQGNAPNEVRSEVERAQCHPPPKRVANEVDRPSLREFLDQRGDRSGEIGEVGMGRKRRRATMAQEVDGGDAQPGNPLAPSPRERREVARRPEKPVQEEHEDRGRPKKVVGQHPPIVGRRTDTEKVSGNTRCHPPSTTGANHLRQRVPPTQHP